jgi:hypothetical protein
MAFLDNSGDIILDAVLTEAGRRRMAQGNFSITQFALGDDEIDYSLYNKNHPSGSAYYDLEILQTPVFEAMTQINAGINYGLLQNTNTDLLYLPTMKMNELGATGISNITTRSGVFLATDKSNDSVTNSIEINITNSGSLQYMSGDGSGEHFVLLETGLDTGINVLPAGTQTNRENFLLANNLTETSFFVFLDSRFFNAVVPIDRTNSVFANNGGTDGTGVNASIKFVNPLSTTSDVDIGLDNYVAYRIPAGRNLVTDNNLNTEQQISVINGPRGDFSGLKLVIKGGMDAEYTLYGSTSNTTYLPGSTVDFIDTTVYVQGASTGAQVQVPVRIIRLS